MKYDIEETLKDVKQEREEYIQLYMSERYKVELLTKENRAYKNATVPVIIGMILVLFNIVGLI